MNNCKVQYRLQWITNKGAVLVVIWSYLAWSVFHLLRNSYTYSEKQRDKDVSDGGIILSLVFSALFYPIGGWLADAYFGRHRLVRYSTCIMWIGTVLVTINEILAHVNSTYNNAAKYWVNIVMFFIMAVGLAGFQSNIIQLGVDQLPDASSTEITSFITWYVLTLYASGITLQYSTECIANVDNSFYIKLLVVALCLSVVLCSDFLFQNWLLKGQIMENSLGLILRVIKYTLKNWKLQNTFTIEDKVPSRFDIAKHRYGGPFTSQQVEDVKSFLRIATIISVVTVVCSGIAPVEYAEQKIASQFYLWYGKVTLSECYKNLTTHYNDYLIAIAVILLYEFVIYPLLMRYLPKVSIATRLFLGIVFFLLRIISLLGIEIAAFTNSSNNTATCIFTEDTGINNIDYRWLLIPGFMSAISTLLIILSGIEFIWAQSPYSMTGLVFGTMYAFLGINTFIQAAVASPFFFINMPWKHIPLTCGIWYFVLQIVAVSGILVLSMIILKKYKKRDRNDD